MSVEMSRQFQRTIEDFTCGNCGATVKGNGYTNHCSSCLYSKHVDVNPGDRASGCGALMKPIGIEMKKGDYIIIHECIDCGHIKKNKRAPEDNFDTIVEISSGGKGLHKDASVSKQEPPITAKNREFK